MSVVEFLGALAFKHRSGTQDGPAAALRGSVATGFAIAKIPFIDASTPFQLAQVQLVVLDAVQLQATGLLDTGTVNFIRHFVGIGGDSLAGLGVETFFELRICRSIWPL